MTSKHIQLSAKAESEVQEEGNKSVGRPAGNTGSLKVTSEGVRTGDFAGSRGLWYSVPSSLREMTSYGQFRRYLKAHLFVISEITPPCDTMIFCSYILTHLESWRKTVAAVTLSHITL